MGKKVPTKDDWSVLKPTVSQWYKTRTANWITDELKRQGYNVTAKMLRDRFKEWELDPKYNRHRPHKKRRRETDKVPASASNSLLLEEGIRIQQDATCADSIGYDTSSDFYGERVSLVPIWPFHTIQTPVLSTPTFAESPNDANFGFHAVLPIRTTEVMHGEHDDDNLQSSIDSMCVLPTINDLYTQLLNPTNVFFAPEPSRTPDTPREDCHLQHTLSEIHRFLDRIIRNKSWLQAMEEPCFELQRLASNAHLAVSSLAYDCHQIWRELSELQSSAAALLPKFWKPCRNMHPRVLTILLRLMVEDCTKPLLELETLKKVKNMLFFVSWEALGKNHPITLLCGMPCEKTKDLLWRQIELVRVRFYARAKHEDPTFVACEKIYCARVLASLGYPLEAEFELRSVIASLGSHGDQYTLADAHRTLGFSMFHSAEVLGKTEEAQVKFLEAACESTYALQLFESIGQGTSENAMYTHHRLACTFRKLKDLEKCEEHFQSALNIWELIRKNHERQGGVKLVRDLDQVLCQQGKFEASQQLRRGYPKYFEESPDTP